MKGQMDFLAQFFAPPLVWYLLAGAILCAITLFGHGMNVYGRSLRWRMTGTWIAGCITTLFIVVVMYVGWMVLTMRHTPTALAFVFGWGIPGVPGFTWLTLEGWRRKEREKCFREIAEAGIMPTPLGTPNPRHDNSPRGNPPVGKG